MRNILNQIEEESNQEAETNLNTLDMFKKNHVMKTMIILLNWVTTSVGSYTLLLNTADLHGDVFMNFILSALLGDLPGTLLLMVAMKCFSRRLNLFLSQAAVGICCFILAFIPKTVNNLSGFLSSAIKQIWTFYFSITSSLWSSSSSGNALVVPLFCLSGSSLLNYIPPI